MDYQPVPRIEHLKRSVTRLGERLGLAGSFRVSLSGLPSELPAGVAVEYTVEIENTIDLELSHLRVIETRVPEGSGSGLEVEQVDETPVLAVGESRVVHRRETFSAGRWTLLVTVLADGPGAAVFQKSIAVKRIVREPTDCHDNGGKRMSEDRVDYEELRRWLCGVMVRTCPSWSSDRREDLVQVALVKILDLERRGERHKLTRPYIRRLAYTVFVNELRGLGREVPTVPIPEDDGPESPPVSETPGPDSQVRAREIGLGVRTCLARLHGPRRRAVVLHLQGHSVREIARLLGWNYKKADNLVYRGMADLRRCLEEQGLRP